MTDIQTYKFILGDCLEELKKLPEKSIDIIITSPPYNIGLKYNKYEDKKPRDQYLEWIYDIFVELKRVLKDDGHIFLNMGYTNKDPWISMEVAIKLKPLFHLQNNITWVKSISLTDNADDTHGHFKPINSKRYITPTNEQIYHFTKNGNIPIDRLAVGVPYKWKCNLKKRTPKRMKVIWKKLDELNLPHTKPEYTELAPEIITLYDELDKLIEKKNKVKPDKRCKGNTWFIPYKTVNSKAQKGYHPATYPENLVEHCIKLSGIKEGCVLDPFIGSGTTIRVAKKMNENTDYNLTGIGIDIDDKYIEYCSTTIL
jgi:site-specific DNA-methyltransferase (adenine-specific)